jgi:hypothetical protein
VGLGGFVLLLPFFPFPCIIPLPFRITDFPIRIIRLPGRVSILATSIASLRIVPVRRMSKPSKPIRFIAMDPMMEGCTLLGLKSCGEMRPSILAGVARIISDGAA